MERDGRAPSGPFRPHPTPGKRLRAAVMRPVSICRTMSFKRAAMPFRPSDSIRKGRNVENTNQREPRSLFEELPAVGARSGWIPGFRPDLGCGPRSPGPGRSVLR